MKTSTPNITIGNEKVNDSTGKQKSNIHCSWGLCKSDTRYAEKLPQIRLFCHSQKITINHSWIHMTRVLKEFLWLPIKYRVKFKILLLTSYLLNLLEFKTPTEFNLWSNCNKYLLQMSNSKLLHGGDRAFYAACPKEWKKLREFIQSAETIPVFKKRLKTYLFHECYQ